ncbi:MAG: hypothetical protein AVDCRST_MAG12-3750, partial [uncultured Rubrobacteraceae bacterium]
GSGWAQGGGRGLRYGRGQGMLRWEARPLEDAGSGDNVACRCGGRDPRPPLPRAHRRRRSTAARRSPTSQTSTGAPPRPPGSRARDLDEKTTSRGTLDEKAPRSIPGCRPAIFPQRLPFALQEGRASL